MARFQDLSREDQELLNTDFGDYEKFASEQVALSSHFFDQGAQFGANAADEFDKIASQEVEADDLMLDEESKIASEELGAFMARGYYDQLVKEGNDRHGDPLYYLMPLIEEKVAAAGGKKAVGLLKSLKDGARKGLDSAKGHVRKYNAGMINDLKSAKSGVSRGKEIGGGARIQSAAKGIAKATPYAALGGSMLGGGVIVSRKVNRDD
jgi:hypothetical protein